jgi:hypothetical protein
MTSAKHLASISSASSKTLRPLKVNTHAVRKSAESVTLADLSKGLPSGVLPFGDAAKGMIERTFKAPSRNAVAEAAAKPLDSSADKITRILAGDTKRIDSHTLIKGLVKYQGLFDAPCPIGGGYGIAIVVMQ